MPYTPPGGNLLNLDLNTTYTPPSGALLNLELAGGNNRITSVTIGDLAVVGTPSLALPLTIAPAGFESSQFGDTWPSLFYRFVYPTAANPPFFPDPTVENAAQRFFAGGISPGGFGTAFVELLTRYVEPNSIGPKAFGATDVSHFLRYIDPNPIGPKGVGSPDVEFKDREIGPATGIGPKGFGSTLVWRTLYIAPIPWEDAVVQPPEELLNNARRSHLQGFDSAAFGVAVVFNAQEHIFPGGWNSEEFFNFDSDLLTRYVAAQPFMGANTPPDQYGTHLFENINREVKPFGYPQQKFGYTFIYNNAEPFYPASIVREGYGTPVIDYVNRERVLEGWQSSVFSPYAAFYNAAKAVYPGGIHDGGLGDRAEIANLNRTVSVYGPPQPEPITGAFIDFAIRYVMTYSVPLPIDAFPTVRRNPEFIGAAGFEAYSTGGHVVEIYLRVIRPSSANVPSVVRVGEPYIHNRNRQLLSNGVDQAEYGRTTVENAIRYLFDFGGIREDEFGTQVIMFRNRTLRVNNIPAPAITVRHRVYNLTPDPAGPSYIFTDGFSTARYGTPWVPNNRVTGAGDIGPRGVGRPTCRDNTIAVGFGFDHDDYVGRPTAYVYKGRITGAGDISSSIAFGLAELDPKYVRARQWPTDSEGTPIDPARYGNHRFYTPHDDYVRTQGIPPGSAPQPRVQLKKRYVYPDGIRSLRIGFARFLNVPQFVDLFTYGVNGASYGRPTVSRPVIPYTGPYTAYPDGIAPKGFGTTRVENQHRTVYPSGFLASLYGTGMIGTTRWHALNGFEATRYGTHRVEFLNRTIEPLGEVETLFNDDDDIGHFPYRTYLTNRLAAGQYTASGIPPGGFGGIGITFNLRQVSPTGINASGVPRPRLAQPHAIAPLGWGGEAFGRTARWSPGELIPYSVDPVGFGQAHLATGVFPTGLDAGSIMTGGAFVRPIRVWGFPPVGFDGPLIYDDAGRNLRFVTPLPILPGKTSRPEVT